MSYVDFQDMLLAPRSRANYEFIRWRMRDRLDCVAKELAESGLHVGGRLSGHEACATLAQIALSVADVPSYCFVGGRAARSSASWLVALHPRYLAISPGLFLARPAAPGFRAWAEQHDR